MANTVTIGVVQTVATTTTGTIKTLAGTTISYSDATLATRTVNLLPVEYVIFDLNGATTTNICTLTSIYAQGLTDANSGHILIASDITRQLQINNACAAKKGADYIEKFEKNIPCDDDLKNDAELMVGLIDSIVDFIPENEIISGNQATYLISVTSTAGTKSVSLLIGLATYSFSSATSTNATFATDIALNINNAYPQNHSYYAEASGANVIISGSDFNTSNGVAVSGSTTNGTITFLAPNALSSGTAPVLHGENAITNEEAQRILDKIGYLCDTPCLDIVNFENE